LHKEFGNNSAVLRYWGEIAFRTHHFKSHIDIAQIASDLATMHLEGIGGASNVTRAISLLNFALSRGNLEAFHTLGWMRQEKGSTRNITQSRLLYWQLLGHKRSNWVIVGWGDVRLFAILNIIFVVFRLRM
jgi:TPR repeat protein